MNRAMQSRFEFGANWYHFIKNDLSEERINTSKTQLLEFLGKDSLKGLTFLDVGCGSGLHSLAAIRALASSVYAFDYDLDSVKATKYALSINGNPSNCFVEQGSILDDTYVQSLPKSDIVYSWGVLHHTGDVWKALNNTTSLVNTNGHLFIALYSLDVQPQADMWLRIKKKYVNSGRLTRIFYQIWYVWKFLLNKNLFRIPELIQRFKTHKKTRGMSLMVDVRDWLGGWPMQFTADQDVIDFCSARSLKLVKLSTGEACSEFLFQKN